MADREGATEELAQRRAVQNRAEQLDALMASFLASRGSNFSSPKPTVTDLYRPGSKGDATWDGWSLHTADGWMIVGQVSERHYCGVKGIDLVNYFTQNYLEDLKTAEEAENKKMKQHDSLPHIPTSQVQHDTNQRNRRHRKGRNNKPRSFFLALPSEMRNLIYSYVVSDARILIRGNHPNKEFNVLKSAWNPFNEPVYRPCYRLSHLLDNDDIEDGLEVSPALLLVCKEVHREIEMFMYAQLSFCFDSMKVAHKFMNAASKRGLKAIRKLELHHTGYGSPVMGEHQRCKDNHDQKWRDTCVRIAKEMPALESLRLQVTIRDWPVTLHSGDNWWKTLMILTTNGPLEHVEVTLSHEWMSRDRMVRASRRLEDRMMSDEGKRARDEREANHQIAMHYQREAAAEVERLERLKLLPPVQAKKVLRIMLDETTSAHHAKDVEKDQNEGLCASDPNSQSARDLEEVTRSLHTNCGAGTHFSGYY